MSWVNHVLITVFMVGVATGYLISKQPCSALGDEVPLRRSSPGPQGLIRPLTRPDTPDRLWLSGDAHQYEFYRRCTGGLRAREIR
jgi:hypothetical protein